MALKLVADSVGEKADNSVVGWAVCSAVHSAANSDTLKGGIEEITVWSKNKCRPIKKNA